MSEFCHIKGKGFGMGFNARNLREFAEGPKRKPKVLVTSCKTLYERLHKCDRKIFCLIRGCYAQIKSEAMKQDFKPVGSDSDSFLMIEVFGIAYPDSWRISEFDAKKYAYIAIKNKYPTIIANYNTFDDIPPEIWDNINASLETVIKESNFQGQFFSLLASTIYSLCRQGAYTRSTANNLQAELSQMHGLSINITMTGVPAYWNSIGKTYNDKVINIVMQYLLRHFTGSKRLTNLVEFSKQYGLTMYYQVMLALRSFPNFDWAMVYSVAQHEFQNYTQARRLVQDRDYFGYNPNIGIAACSNYPNLAYVSWRLNEMVGGQSSLARLNQKFASMVNKNRWDKLVREYRNQIEDELIDEQRNLDNLPFSTIAARLMKQDNDVSSPINLINGNISHDPRLPGDDDDNDNAQPGPSGGTGAMSTIKKRWYGVGINAQTLRELGSPKVKPKGASFSTIAAELMKPVKDNVSPPSDLINGDISHYDPRSPRDDDVDDNDQLGLSGGAAAIQELDQPPEILDDQNEDEDDAPFKAKRPRTAPPAEDTAWTFR